MQLPSAPAAQQQIEKLAEQNRRMQDELDKWHAYYAAQTTARPVANPVPATPGSPGYLPPVGPPATIGITDSPAASTARRSLPGAPANFHPVPVAPIRLRSHTVTAGETMAAIARKAGVSLPALQAANPGVNPKKLRAGQTLNLPPF
jgi:nucleoid-associated protein YgaU